MRLPLIAAVLPALVVCNAAAVAQVTGIANPTPAIAATSPLGLGTSLGVFQTGIPLGATEIASPGVSPAPVVTGAASTPSSGTCSTLGISPSAMFGSSSSYDGGGMAVGSAAPATAATSGMPTSYGAPSASGLSMVQTSPMSGMCGAGSSTVVSSSTPTSTSPTAPGGMARTGIPLGSIEIGNLGVSSAAAVPLASVSPMVAPSPIVPVMPTVSTPSAVLSTTANSFQCPPTGHGAGATVC
jgi:hypothetical protein